MGTTSGLQIAWAQVRSRSRCPGIDRVTPALFGAIATTELPHLADQMQTGQYRPRPALGIYLRRGKKTQRLVGIATVRDRIVQRYLLQQLMPLAEAQFYPGSYAYRPGHSAKQAVDHLVTAYLNRPGWILQSDIRDFFDALCWPVLEATLDALALTPQERIWVQQQVQMPLVLSGRWVPRHQGVLQGSALSGLLANLYLNGFDHACFQAGIPLVRYGDDLAVVCSSEAQAQAIQAQIAQWLGQLHLTLNPDKTHISSPDAEFVYLGHRIQRGEIVDTLKNWSPYQRQKGGRSGSLALARPRPMSDVHRSRIAPSYAPDNHYWSDPMTTLYITDQGAYLRTQQQRFQVFCDHELRCEVPINQVSHVVLFGCCNVSHGAARLALQRRIPVVYLSYQGRYYGRLETSGQAELDYLTQQVLRAQDPSFRRSMAETMVQGKLHNSRMVLQRLNRRGSTAEAESAIAALSDLATKLPQAESIEALLGYEGQGAKQYFRGLGSLFTGDLAFEGRTLRPPKDPINSLLSLGYTLLHQSIFATVVAAGLHTHFGHLHTSRKNHPALVMDLTEEFRAPVVDSLVSYVINANILKAEDFTPPDERGGVYLHPGSLKVFLKHWEDRMQTEITHPHTGYKVTYRRCLELQVWEYVACLMAQRDTYRPMLWSK